MRFKLMSSTAMVIALLWFSQQKERIHVDGEECVESYATASSVESCPQTAKEWEEAASRKNCENIQNNCSSFEYHCVINAWQNETVEVCAPRLTIVGNVCTEYNFGGSRIQRHDDHKCDTCPISYCSTEMFKYQECYGLVYKAREKMRSTFIGISFTVEATDTPNSTSHTQHTAAKHQPKSDLETKIIFPICVGIVFFIILVVTLLHFLLHMCRRKESFSIKKSAPCEGRTDDIESTLLQKESEEYTLVLKDITLEE